MTTHVFSEIFLHVNWHVDRDRSVLVGEVEQWVHAYLQNRCRTTRGVFFHGIGGTDDHLHLAVRIEPFVTISDLIGELKGACSHEANQHFGRKFLSWQRGYGVVSFGKGNLQWVLEYLRGQRQHHARGSVHARLETIDPNLEPGGCNEEPAEYGPAT